MVVPEHCPYIRRPRLSYALGLPHIPVCNLCVCLVSVFVSVCVCACMCVCLCVCVCVCVFESVAVGLRWDT
jgi:hypothetical protein